MWKALAMRVRVREGRVSLRIFTVSGALVLVCLALSPFRVGAETRLPAARDLAGDAASISRDGRVLLVLFSQHGCPWCERVRREFLLPIQKNESYTSRLVFRQIDLDRGTPLRDFGGKATTHADFGRMNGVTLYPTVMLFGPRGERLAEPLRGFTGSDFYGAYLDQRIEEAVGGLRRQ